MIQLKDIGTFSNTKKWLKKIAQTNHVENILKKYAEQGRQALADATPRDTGGVASCWTYEIRRTRTTTSIIYRNTKTNAGIPIAILLQYGHGTGNGGYVQGRDYINPAIRPIFDKMVNDLWEEVTKV